MKPTSRGLPILLACVAVLAVACTWSSADRNSPATLELRGDIEYWNDTHAAMTRLQNRMTPIAQELISIGPALDLAELDAWENLGSELAPVMADIYSEVLRAYILVTPPVSRDLPELYFAETDNFGGKRTVMSAVAAAWAVGDYEATIDAYVSLFDLTETGKTIDRQRVELARRITNGCAQFDIPECDGVAGATR